MLYFGVLIIILWSVFAFDINERKYKSEVVFKTIFVFLTLLAGFQYCVGSDTPVYMHEFDAASWNDLFESSIIQIGTRQIGWLLLVNVVKSVFKEYFFLQLIVASFISYSLTNFIWRNAKHPFSVLLLLYFGLYFDVYYNLLRQGISMGLFLLSFESYSNKKWKSYYAYIIAAYLFHSSAIVLFILPLFRTVANNYKSLLGIMILMLLFGSIVFNYMSNDIASVFIGHEYIDQYIYSDVYGISQTTFSSAFLSNMVKLSLLIYFIKFKIYNNESIIPMLCVFCLVATFAAKLVILGRFLKYFMPFVLLYEVEISYAISERYFNNMRRAVTVLLLIMSLYSPIKQLLLVNPSFEAPNYCQYYPYYSIFNKEIPTVRRQFLR